MNSNSLNEMKFLKLFAFFISFIHCFAQNNSPEQIHLSLGANEEEMTVTWVTPHRLSTVPKVEYGLNAYEHEANGLTTNFTDDGSEKRHMYIHRVTIKGLQPKQRYIYRCGSSDEWSKQYSFVTLSSGTEWSPRFAIYGDMGKVNAQSVPRLTTDVENSLYDVIFHIGDFAYDMNSDNARVGDAFMRLIEPIAAKIPYMTCAGNHEIHNNFSNYENRFSMVNGLSGQHNNQFHSFNIGKAHIVMFSTEFYYATEYGWDQIQRQYEWLERDLKEANEPQNRAKRPWLITMGHRPLYCAKIGDDSCDEQHFERTSIRKGVQIRHTGNVLYGLEDLFYEYGVDIEFYGHEHYYHRLFPVYNNQVFNGTKANPYENPKAPIHITTGSAGCPERHATFNKGLPHWSAFKNSDYGYTRLEIHNSTHISLQQVSDDQKGVIVDSITIIKEKHGPEAWL